MDLNVVAKEIREIIENRRKEINLTFVEDKHIYYMKDLDGKIKNNFLSVSKVIGKFYSKFDSNSKALSMCNGDINAANKLLEEWKMAGTISTNMGSRTHFLLETDLINRYGSYKEVRQPIFNVNDEQIRKSDMMVEAGKKYIDLMHERGAVLLDTEMVLGDPELRYTGQPDKTWLMFNREKTDFGVVITDWKTNQPKNFEIQPYTNKLYYPFEEYYNNALGHYYLQLPFYAKLLLKMLQNTKYSDIKLLGCVVVLLKDDGTFVEYKVPTKISATVLMMNTKNYLK